MNSRSSPVAKQANFCNSFAFYSCVLFLVFLRLRSSCHAEAKNFASHEHLILSFTAPLRLRCLLSKGHVFVELGEIAMRRIVGLCGLLAMLMAANHARAAEPLVNAEWLAANLGKSGIVVLDVRSGAGITKADYFAGHIPGAVFTDYRKDGWREKDKHGTPDMLPEPAKLEKLIGRLGIDNATHVILVPEGARAQDMAAATRLYWTFKAMGHDNVSILDGGWAEWAKIDEKTKRPRYPIERGEVRPAAKTFKARPRADMLVGKDEVKKAMEAKLPLVDNRPQDFFVGLSKSPSVKRAGTIPGALSLPESWLTQNNGGLFRSKAELEKIYAAAGVPTNGRQINFCNTGHWASLGWFVSHALLGNSEAKMYDGSLAEWAADASLPVEQKIKLR